MKSFILIPLFLTFAQCHQARLSYKKHLRVQNETKTYNINERTFYNKRVIQEVDSNSNATDIFCKNIFFVTDGAPSTWLCDIDEINEVNGEIIMSEVTYVLTGIPSYLELDNKSDILSGETQMMIQNGAQYVSQNLTIDLPLEIPDDVLITINPIPVVGRSSNSATTGTKQTLIIRVKGSKSGENPTADAATMSASVFGGNNDNFNLKSGIEACSYDKLIIEKASGYPEIVDGVLEVTLGISTSDQANIPMVNNVNLELENEVKKEAKAKLGTTEEITDIFDLVMICLPPNTNVKTAYARGGGKLSVFNDNYCLSPSVQMHEIGHNIRLYHAYENGEEYEDRSGLMGNSYSSEFESPHMCYNGGKSWLLGWYEDKSISVKLDESNNYSWSGNLVGVTDYERAEDQMYVVVEFILGEKDADDISRNIYLVYNNKEGINSEVKEFGDQVTITKAAVRHTNHGLREHRDASDHLAALSLGNIHTIENYADTGENLMIKVCGLAVGDPKTAFVSAFLSSGIDPCPEVESCRRSSFQKYLLTILQLFTTPITEIIPVPPARSDNRALRNGFISFGAIFAVLLLVRMSCYFSEARKRYAESENEIDEVENNNQL